MAGAYDESKDVVIWSVESSTGLILSIRRYDNGPAKLAVSRRSKGKNGQGPDRFFQVNRFTREDLAFLYSQFNEIARYVE